MDQTTVTPRKRVLSTSSSPGDVDVDNTNPDAFPLFPSSKRFKTAHRWLYQDDELIQYVPEHFRQSPTTPSAQIMGKTGQDSLTTITLKRETYQFEDDRMAIDSDTSKSEFQHPKISTPDSVKGFVIAEDDEQDVFNDGPAYGSPANVLNPRRAYYESLESDLDSEPETPFESAMYSHDDEPHSPADLSSDGADADEELSVPDSPAYDDDDYDDDHASPSLPHPPPSPHNQIKWIRKRKPYGIVLAPQQHSDESVYETSTDDDADDDYIADDERDHAAPKTTHPRVWTEREEQVFRALVCDYGRKWARFVHLFPELSVGEIEAHYAHVVSTHPEFRLDEVADAAENGEFWFTPPRRVGHWGVLAGGSERLVLKGGRVE